VRRPIFHASGVDINDAVKENQKNDTEAMYKNNLIHQLFNTFGDKKFTTKDIIKEAGPKFDSGGNANDNDLNEALTDILDKRSCSTNSVGRYLGTLVDNVFDGMILKSHRSNVVKWSIESSFAK
jgi:hypothetical protein